MEAGKDTAYYHCPRTGFLPLLGGGHEGDLSLQYWVTLKRGCEDQMPEEAQRQFLFKGKRKMIRIHQVIKSLLTYNIK